MALDTFHPPAGFGTRELNPPEQNDLPAVWDLVLADIEARDEKGTLKYGQRLKPFDGRDPMIDLYQELFDALVYCRKHLYEKYGV